MKDKDFVKKILVPVDGSDSSLLAKETASIVAKKTEATITVLYVVREVEAYYRLLYAAEGLEENIPKSIIKEILDSTEQEASKVVNDTRASFNEEGISVDSKILKGIDPADSIIEFSKKDYDLIIMGSWKKREGPTRTGKRNQESYKTYHMSHTNHKEGLLHIQFACMH